MDISGPQVPNYLITGDGSILRCKILSVGAWNMDITDNKEITHGLTASKIREVSAIIYDDSGAIYKMVHEPSVTSVLTLDGGIQWVTATVVRLWRKTGGRYDQAAFDDAVMNRGYVMVWYVD